MSVIQHRYCYREPAEDDLISRLPDEILVIILSNLTTEDAVRTSILSSRWTSLWLYTSRLDLSASLRLVKGLDWKEDSSKYASMLSHVLQMHRSSALDEFSLRLDYGCFVYRNIGIYESMLSHVLSPVINASPIKTKRLELDLIDFFSAYSRTRVPPSYSDGYEYWFSEICSCCVWISKPFYDRCFDADSLKELNLKGLNLEDEHIHFFLLKFRCLESLTVVGAYKLPRLVLSSSSLKYLNITLTEEPAKSFNISSCPNLRTLVIENEGEVMLTDVPVLTELHIYGLRDPNHSLNNGILCHLSRLEALMLHSKDLQSFMKFGEVPELTNLKTLTINIGIWKDESLIGLTSFINACPNLHKFVLQLYWVRQSRIKGVYERIKRPLKPEQLKVVEVSGYYGHAPEDELIMHLLDNAVAVKQLVLDPRSNTSFVRTPIITSVKKQEKARKLASLLQNSVPSEIQVIILS